MPRLDTLPPEILFHILSYTEPICSLGLDSYPLNALAETNKQLNAIVEEYARNLLKRYVDIVPPRNSKVFTCRRKWLGELCYFCKKNSKRRACFYRTLTCCYACDKKEFEKMTMTEATHQTHLSKLDLFTPSPLHPTLPPLTTGSYPAIGATMLSKPDVLARSAYIRSLLGDKAQDDAFMRVRPATHERIIKHLNIEYYEGKGWFEMPDLGEGERKGPKSMATREGRRAYVEKGLRREWEAMGVEPYEDVMLGVRRRWVRRNGKGKERVGGSAEVPVEIN